MRVEYRFRLHDGNPATLATFQAMAGGLALEVTSVRGGTNPYLAEEPPTGEGSEVDPLTGRVSVGAFSGEIIDELTGGTSRLFTSLLEDAGARDQLGDRWAAWDLRTDGGAWTNLITGYLTQYRVVDDIAWQVTVSDPFRVATEYTAFAPQPGDTIAAYLARWPKRGCIIGGPVIGGFLGAKDLGGIDVVAWEAYTDGDCTIGPIGSGAMTHLAFRSGYVPPKFKRTTKAADVGAIANPAADPFSVQTSSPQPYFATVLGRTFWPGLVHQLTDPATGTVTYHSVDNGWMYRPIFYPGGRTDLGIVVDKRSIAGLFVAGAVPIDRNKILKLRTFTIAPTEQSPIYDTLHPVDWIARLWTEAGITYDAASVEAAREQLGSDLRVSLRITEPTKLQSFLEATFYGPFGIGARNGSSGRMQLVCTRIFGSVAPALQITAADTADGESDPFELRSNTAINKVIIECQRMVRWASEESEPLYYGRGGYFETRAWMNRYAAAGKFQKRPDPPPDGFAAQDIRFERTNADPGATGRGELTYRIPGIVHLRDAVGDALPDWVDARAREIFDRWGRGIREAETFLLADGAGAGAQLGDELLFGVPELPNHNKRLGDDPTVAARAVQITRLTRHPEGLAVKLLDSGAGAQPLGTVPVLTIAASTADPKRVAQVTVTNAATLNTAGYGARIRMATTAAGAAVATAFTDVLAYAPGEIPTDPIRLPAVTAGMRVHAEARSELAGFRPSNWSAPVSLTLTAIAAPSAMTATPDGTDGSQCLVAWTAGDASLITDVYLRHTAEPAAADVRVRQLEPGSTRILLEELTPGANYTVGVEHRDANSGDVSARVSLSFVAGSAITALSVPAFERAFAGSWDQNGIWQRDGVYGMVVVATVRPGYLAVEEAVETGVGTGVYGAFADVGRVPCVQGAWTRWSGTAPNDGKRRKLRGRHTRDGGAAASAYTDELVVTPWTPLPLPGYPTNVSLRVRVLDPLDSTEAATLVRVQVDYIDPAGTAGTVQLTRLSANSSVLAGPTVLAAPVASGQAWKLARPTRGAGVGQADFAGFGQTGDVETRLELPEQGTGPSVSVRATPGSSSYTIEWSGTTVTLSIDGGAYAAPPASPFAVARNAAGGAFKEYTFRSVVGAETITNLVTIPPLDKDTVTPDLSVVQTARTSTTTEFTASVAVPGGGVYDLQVQIYGDATWYYSSNGGTTWNGPYAAGTLLTGLSSGWTYRCMRAPFNSGQSTMKWRTSTTGGGAEEVNRTIPNQDKTSFGPTLYLSSTQGSTSYSIGYTATGTVEYQIDNGGWAAPAANPFTVARNAAGGNDKVVHVRATLDGQTVADSVTVPAQDSTGGGSGQVSFTAPAVSIDITTDTFALSWTSTALPTSGYYEVLWHDDYNHPDWLSSGYTGTTGSTSGSDSIGSTEHGYDLLNAGPTHQFSCYILAFNSAGAVIGQSPTTVKTFRA